MQVNCASMDFSQKFQKNNEPFSFYGPFYTRFLVRHSLLQEKLCHNAQVNNWNLAGQNFMRALACGSFAMFVCVACESLRAFSRLRNAKACYIFYFTICRKSVIISLLGLSLTISKI